MKWQVMAFEDTEDQWDKAYSKDPTTYEYYTHKLDTAVSKKVYVESGSIKYSDGRRFINISIIDTRMLYPDEWMIDILDDLDPISMPYTRTEKQWYTYWKYESGDPYNTATFIKYINPSGETVEVNRKFKIIDSKNCEEVTE